MNQVVKDMVQRSLDDIRPYLKEDGGDVELVDISDDMIVSIRLLGSCSTCSMSEMTMKAGLEDGIKQAVPQIKAVVAV